MKTKQEIHDKIKEVKGELKYQDGPNLYWQRGQMDALHWVLGVYSLEDLESVSYLHTKNIKTLEEMEAEDPDVFKNKEEN